MSSQPLWLRDLVAFSLQTAALVGVGVIMARLLRLRVPRVRLAYWQALLAVCVFLPLLQPWRPEVLDSSGLVTSSVTFGATPAALTGLSLAEIVLFLIGAGIVLRALWMALGLGRLWVYRRHAQRIEAVPHAVEEAQRLVPVFPRFFISRQLPTPATFGFFRPAILFPSRILEMDAPMQKAIALHELLHVERLDWLWNMFEEAVLTLLWFHLPLWWVVRSARLSREQVVDAEAVRRSKARRPYLKALLEMAGQPSLAESLPAPLFLRESQLAERVALMMKEVHMSRTRLTVSILMAAGVLLISGATLVWAFPLKTSVQDVEASAVSSMAVSAEGAVAGNASPTGNSVAAETNPGQEGTKVYKVGDNVKAPEAIYKQQPRYTREAKKNHVTGKVELLCTIDAKGNVSEINEVSKPLGAGLDESAITAVRNWKYKPATRDGVSVPVKTTITINFTLLEKSGKDSQKSTSAIDPPAQTEQKRPDAAKDNGPSVKINQAELQRQIEQAMKQARIAQQAVPKIDEAEIQRQVEEAMRQAKIAQDAASKIDQAKIQQQVEKAMRQLQKLNMPEMRQKMQEQMKQLEKLNTSEMRQQRKQALEQARIAQQAAAKIDKAEIRRQIEQAKRQVAEAKRQTQQARHQKEAARKEAEKARHDAEKQRKEIEPPLPPASPSPQELMPAPPAPPSPQGLVPHPPAPPSPPAPSQNH